MRADAAFTFDKDLELIGLVEMCRRNSARWLDDQESLRQAVVVDLVPVNVRPFLRGRADIFCERVVTPIHFHLSRPPHRIGGRCR
jgi:hypothetical protein